jgi:hypothetical protein
MEAFGFKVRVKKNSEFCAVTHPVWVSKNAAFYADFKIIEKTAKSSHTKRYQQESEGNMHFFHFYS